MEPLWEQYFPRLVALARKLLPSKIRQSGDEQDAAQSALISFWHRIRQGFDPELDRNEIWRMLVTITRNKAIRMAKRERSLKRGSGQVIRESDFGPDQPTLDTISGYVEPESLDVLTTEYLSILDEGLQQFTLLRLAGFTNREIKQILQVSESTVERKLRIVRRIWSDMAG